MTLPPPAFSDEDAAETIQEIMDTLQSVKTQSQAAERRTCMTQLIRMTREGRSGVIGDNFRAVLRLLLENLSDESGATRALVFGVLTEMLKQETLIPSFQAFTELIILKVLEAHRDDEKDVSESTWKATYTILLVISSSVYFFSPAKKTTDTSFNFPIRVAVRGGGGKVYVGFKLGRKKMLLKKVASYFRSSFLLPLFLLRGNSRGSSS